MIDLSMVHQPGKSIYLQKCNLHARKSTKERNKETPSVQPPDKTVVSCCHIFAKSQHLLLVWTAGMYHAYRLHRWQTNRSCRPVQVMLTTFLFQIFPHSSEPKPDAFPDLPGLHGKKFRAGLVYTRCTTQFSSVGTQRISPTFWKLYTIYLLHAIWRIAIHYFLVPFAHVFVRFWLVRFKCSWNFQSASTILFSPPMCSNNPSGQIFKNRVNNKLVVVGVTSPDTTQMHTDFMASASDWGALRWMCCSLLASDACAALHVAEAHPS